MAVRLRHLSRRTEKTYVAWIRRFILFHGKRHPNELGPPDVTAFLSALAVRDRVASSTQNQALAALLFLYRVVLDRDVPWLDDVVRAKRTPRLPVVLARDEVAAVLAALEPDRRLIATLLYGAGLRLLECLRLRVKDVDFARSQLVVRGGKGDRDRSCHEPVGFRSRGTSTAFEGSTNGTRHSAPARSRCRSRSPASRRPPDGSGPGNGSFPRRAPTAIGRQASVAAITCTRPSSSTPCAKPRAAPASGSASPATPSATRSRRICSRTATTSARRRPCWATATCARPGLHPRPRPRPRRRPEPDRPSAGRCVRPGTDRPRLSAPAHLANRSAVPAATSTHYGVPTVSRSTLSRDACRVLDSGGRDWAGPSNCR